MFCKTKRNRLSGLCGLRGLKHLVVVIHDSNKYICLFKKTGSLGVLNLTREKYLIR